MKNIWDTPGGIHVVENKSQSNSTPIASIPLADELVIPLSQHIGSPAQVLCSVGDRVRKGQMIAESSGHISTAVHASSSGIITAIEYRAIPHPSGLSAQCVILKPDGKDEWVRMNEIEDAQAVDPAILLQRIRDAGIAGMGGAGFPTAVKLQARPTQPIDTLIINGAECEPYITADDMLMRERAQDIVQGIAIISTLLGKPETVIIGIEDNKPEAIHAMKTAISDTPYSVVCIPTKYPSGGEKQLIQILTGKEVPSGTLPSALGLVVQNVGTAAAVYRAVRFGEALVSRVTTVVGKALQVEQNIDIPIGTPIHHILRYHQFQAENCERIIIGGPMMGYTTGNTGVPIVKTTNCLLVPSKKELPLAKPQQPCIRCGMCAEACPASLLPQQLFWFSQSEDFDRLQSHHLFDCIECGACSYVCPSNIPLVQHYRASKGAIRLHNEEKQKAERSRQRFEFRQQRIQQADAEKEAKRAERKRAADAAKKAKKDGKTTHIVDASSVAKLQDQVTVVSSTTSLAKLERARSSALSRLERAKVTLGDAKTEGDEARISTLAARVKAAELKLNEADKRIDAFRAEQNAPVASKPNALAEVEQKITSIEKRLTAASEKLRLAEKDNPTLVPALRSGVEKLEEKLQDNRQLLASMEKHASMENTG